MKRRICSSRTTTCSSVRSSARLEVARYHVLASPSGEEAIDVLKHEDADVVLTDKRLPGMDGVELVRRVKTERPDLAIVVMTAYGTIESAVDSVRLGAANYLVKPFEVAELLIVVRTAIEVCELRAANRATLRRNQERFTLRNVLARSAAMHEVFELLRSVAEMDTTLLLFGETGVGKELLARSVHYSGSRRDKPFVGDELCRHPGRAVRVGAVRVPQGRVHQRFGDARGHLQSANGGTLVLDEIGEMPLALQSKLLRVIEEKRVTSIGSDRAVEVDVRFIATTNKDLQAEVERGTFRRDLFYRLAVMPIRVPPLRERIEDIPLLAQHFLEVSARRSKKVMQGIAPAAMQALARYAWPGNVRELENVIERAVIVAKSETVNEVDRFLTGNGEHGRVDLSLPFRDAKARVVEEFERAYIGGVLEAHGGSSPRPPSMPTWTRRISRRSWRATACGSPRRRRLPKSNPLAERHGHAGARSVGGLGGARSPPCKSVRADLEVRAAVARPAGFRPLVALGPLLAVADHRDPRRGHALADEIVPRRRRAELSQGQVVGVGAALVAVAFDQHLRAAVGAEPEGIGVEDAPGVRPDLVPVVVEEDVGQIRDELEVLWARTVERSNGLVAVEAQRPASACERGDTPTCVDGSAVPTAGPGEGVETPTAVAGCLAQPAPTSESGSWALRSFACSRSSAPPWSGGRGCPA